MARDEAVRVLRARWLTALGDASYVLANWKQDDTARPDPAAVALWVEESIAGESAIDAAAGRAPRFRRYSGVIQIMLHGRVDSGTKPILDLADAIELALVTGATLVLSSGNPVLVTDVTLGDPREAEPWYKIPMAIFYTYDVALVAA